MRTKTKRQEVGTCRTCFKEMEHPYWTPGGGWYCNQECKDIAKQGTAKGPLAVRKYKKKPHKKRWEMPEYQAYINSNAWQIKRRTLLEKCDYCCQDCGVRQESGLHVHHLTYDRFGHEAEEDLRVVCRGCHRRAHHEKKRSNLWRGGRYRVMPAGRGEFKVVDMEKRNRELIRMKSLYHAVEFAKGAEAATG